MPKNKVPNKKKIRSEPKTSADRSRVSPPEKERDKRFPIVGIGASAGGLEALKTFFSRLPGDCGLAFIVVVHMSPKQPSLLPDLLQKVASIPTSFAKDGEPIEPNHIYVISPDKDISVFKGHIQLLDMVRKIDNRVNCVGVFLVVAVNMFTGIPITL